MLIHILKMAASQPEADTLPSDRLIKDMQPLSFQVRSVSNTVTRSLKRLIGVVEAWEDNETTIGQLITRAEKTLALLQSIDPGKLEGKDTVTVELPSGQFTGKQFILGFGLPNLFFHLQTAYAIFRMKGVPLGKADYMEPWNRYW